MNMEERSEYGSAEFDVIDLRCDVTGAATSVSRSGCSIRLYWHVYGAEYRSRRRGTEHRLRPRPVLGIDRGLQRQQNRSFLRAQGAGGRNH